MMVSGPRPVSGRPSPTARNAFRVAGSLWNGRSLQWVARVIRSACSPLMFRLVSVCSQNISILMHPTCVGRHSKTRDCEKRGWQGWGHCRSGGWV